MDQEQQPFERLKHTIATRASVKQDVYAATKAIFGDMREVVASMTQELFDEIHTKDERIQISMDAESDHQLLMTMAGDTMVFQMHTNVFTFPPKHMIHKSPYVIKNTDNAYCGIIHIYNFLTDSFRFNRSNDSGYLIGRIFVNHERHFFVEGRGQLGVKYNNFSTSNLDKAALRDIIETALNHAIDFELFTPPIGAVDVVSLTDIKQIGQHHRLQTAKRLGFRFQTEENEEVSF